MRKKYAFPSAPWYRVRQSLEILSLTNPGMVTETLFDGNPAQQKKTMVALLWLEIIHPSQRVTSKGRKALGSPRALREHLLDIVERKGKVDWKSWGNTCQAHKIKVDAQKFFLVNMLVELYNNVPNGATVPSYQQKGTGTSQKLEAARALAKAAAEPAFVPKEETELNLPGVEKEPAPSTLRKKESPAVPIMEELMQEGGMIYEILAKFPQPEDKWPIEKVDSYVNVLRDAMVVEYT